MYEQQTNENCDDGQLPCVILLTYRGGRHPADSRSSAKTDKFVISTFINRSEETTFPPVLKQTLKIGQISECLFKSAKGIYIMNTAVYYNSIQASWMNNKGDAGSRTVN